MQKRFAALGWWIWGEQAAKDPSMPYFAFLFFTVLVAGPLSFVFGLSDFAALGTSLIIAVLTFLVLTEILLRRES